MGCSGEPCPAGIPGSSGNAFCEVSKSHGSPENNKLMEKKELKKLIEQTKRDLEFHEQLAKEKKEILEALKLKLYGKKI